MRNNLPFINVYKKRSINSEVVTQILYGEHFKKVQGFNSWIKIKNNIDNYSGYIKKRAFPKNWRNTHKVFKLYSYLYLQASNGSKTNTKLSFGSKIKVSKKKNGFYKFDNYWIKKKDLKDINYTTKDTFKNIKSFINVKYKWGGKYFKGVDCSGLIQLFFNFNNKFCPRDAKDQIKYFKRRVEIKYIKKGDLIFWKGHVALAISKSHLIHAYGPLKKTIVMPIKGAIKRIYKTANLKVLEIKRPKL